MNSCVICGKERDLFDLEMDHLEEELGEENIRYKLCGTCWETIFEIAYKAAKKAIKDKSDEIGNEYRLISDIDEEIKEKLDRALYVFKAIKAISKNPDEFHYSLEGRPYVYMGRIRDLTNELLEDRGMELSPQMIGYQIREVLKIETGNRQGPGVPVFIEEKQIEDLSEYYDVKM
mgnify:CR=1 FL=1